MEQAMSEWIINRQIGKYAWCLTVVMLLLWSTAADAQQSKQRGTRNVRVLSNVPLGGAAPVNAQRTSGFEGLGRRTADIEIEQDLSRPYVYVSRRFTPTGFDILGLEDPRNPTRLFSWEIEHPELHSGSGALDGKYFKLDGRYYYVQSFQFRQGGADHDLGAIVFDVTGLPDGSQVTEVGRIQGPVNVGGFHNIFMYKHSDGRALLFATAGDSAHVYDMGRFLDGAPDHGLVAKLTVPDWVEVAGGYHDFYIAYHPATGQDRFYGAGSGGYHIYDISDLDNPVHLTSIDNTAVRRGHTITPTPDGRYVVTEVEYRTAPLRIFDLKPGLDGQVGRIRTAIGAWTANWRNFSHNHEVRWPYVFVAALDDGFQVFNMRDPTDPYTIGYYDTWDGPDGGLEDRRTTFNGGWGVDVRNADGLIVVSDFNTGLWVFELEAFQGWDGNGWGMPNISSVQDWDNGPVHQAWPGQATRDRGPGAASPARTAGTSWTGVSRKAHNEEGGR